LRQDRGTTWSYVQPQLSPRSHFTVTTPSATAVARGTSFEVAVVAPDADGTVLTKVSVFEGQVDVVAAGQVRPVAAGRVAEVAQGSSPRVPDAASVPPLCLRLATSSPVMLTVTDPEGRAAGQTAVRRISQIPWSIVSGPQEQPQRVDIFSPPSGEWEVGVAPRGEGGDFELVVSAVAGTKTVTPTVLTGSVVPGERLAIGFHLGNDGELDRFGSFVRTTRTRANIAIDRIGATTTAPLPYAKRFASAADSPHGCGS
jgi:hypothetical protein